MVHIIDSTNIHFTGNGTIDGQGFNWWLALLENKVGHTGRPNLIEFSNVTNSTIEHIKTLNSPRFNYHLYEVKNLTCRYLDIRADVWKMIDLAKKFNWFDWKLNVPMFPFNTDGIDPAGEDIHIHDCYIENYDDAIAVKPLNSNDKYPCSKNVLVEDIKVKFGVGMSIGSIGVS